MVTTNERSFMAASMRAVAAICANAPSNAHGQKEALGRGSDPPKAIVMPASERNANGNPNRKRTWVAPTVPRLPVSSRCMALRAVWAAAAMMVKSAHSQLESIIDPRPSGRPLGQHHVIHVQVVRQL